MIDFENIANLYFLGIGGIGMSALARYAKAVGKVAAGYDLTETELTRQLQQEGINVHYTDEINQLPNNFQSINTLVVRTPAVPETLGEFQYLKSNGYQIVKRSELLGFLTSNRFCIAVAGTHGKTSVSTMITHLLHETGKNIGAFLGGISRNFNSNLVLPESPDSMIVTEADEFDRSFLHLHPDISVVTAVDPDHLDVYGNYEEIKKAFASFVCNTKKGGKALFNKRIKFSPYINCDVEPCFYSIDEDADFCAKNIKIIEGNFHFDLYTPFMIIPDIKMGYPGRVNLENMVAAIAVSILTGADPMTIRDAVQSYKGVKRRFDIRFRNEKFIYIDDYAHHPKELEATIKSVKELYRNKKVLGIFQPHLFSRTRDFAPGFAQSLDLLDEAILLDIYPAREQPIPGVTSEIIFSRMKLKNKSMSRMDEIVSVLRQKKFDILLTLGAGNIDTLVQPVCEMLKKKMK